MISSLILFNFVTQIIVDIRPKGTVTVAPLLLRHVCGAAGLLFPGILPRILPPFFGSGECHNDHRCGRRDDRGYHQSHHRFSSQRCKRRQNEPLHSFYCWGQVGVVLITTLAVKLIGEEYWWLLPLFWALVPAYNIMKFAKGASDAHHSSRREIPLGALCRSKIFFFSHGAYALRRCVRTCHEPVEFSVCRKGAGRSKSFGRPVRALPLCRVHGNRQNDLWNLGCKA